MGKQMTSVDMVAMGVPVELAETAARWYQMGIDGGLQPDDLVAILRGRGRVVQKVGVNSGTIVGAVIGSFK